MPPARSPSASTTLLEIWSPYPVSGGHAEARDGARRVDGRRPDAVDEVHVQQQVLHHEVARQAALEVVAVDDLGEAVQRREVHAAGGVQHVEERVEVEPRLLRGDHHLGRRGEADAVEEVVQQLGHVAGAAGSHVEDLRAERVEDRAHALQRVLRAPGHQRERALLGGGGAPGDAGVEVLGALLGEVGVDCLRRRRRGGAQVDDDLTGPRGPEHAVVAAHDALDDRAVAAETGGRPPPPR